MHESRPSGSGSGYAGEALVRHGVGLSALNFPEKPFSPTRLLETVVALLPSAPPEPAPGD